MRGIHQVAGDQTRVVDYRSERSGRGRDNGIHCDKVRNGAGIRIWPISNAANDKGIIVGKVSGNVLVTLPHVGEISRHQRVAPGVAGAAAGDGSRALNATYGQGDRVNPGERVAVGTPTRVECRDGAGEGDAGTSFGGIDDVVGGNRRIDGYFGHAFCPLGLKKTNMIFFLGGVIYRIQ